VTFSKLCWFTSVLINFKICINVIIIQNHVSMENLDYKLEIFRTF